MKKAFIGIIILGLLFNLTLTGCSLKKTSSSREAVEIAKKMTTDKQKVDYLLKQAQAFYDAKDYRGAIEIAQYVKIHIDNSSEKAKDILAKARQALRTARTKKTTK